MPAVEGNRAWLEHTSTPSPALMKSQLDPKSILHIDLEDLSSPTNHLKLANQKPFENLLL